MTENMNPGFRDAIHVPFIVCRCTAPLDRGQRVSLRRDNYCVEWKRGDEITWHGVVDPLMDQENVAPLTPVRVFMRPGFYSQLTHTFTIETHDRGGTSTCHDVCDIF